ncbi:MAG TPA: RNA methyltransferase [Chryseosolibacter sp.]
MLSKADIRYIKSLQVKKYRKQEQCFIVEGAKSVQELLQSDFHVVTLLGTPDFLTTIDPKINARVEEVSEKDLEGLGEFQTSNSAVAVARMKPNRPVMLLDHQYALVLDDIRDPGNLGTIIRTADWYGINSIIASSETADFYNPKVINSTMGSFTRASIYYTDLVSFLDSVKGRPIYGAYLEGQNIYKTKFAAGGFIVIGNESRGINGVLEKYISQKITIPRVGKAESLNAAIATAVILDNLRRPS